jgi:DNA-binding response OmpR family regulator
MKSGLRILIVEDEMLVALLAEALISDLGHHPVGPAFSLDDAVALARDEPLDAAMLDMNLGEVKSFPVADILRERGVPFFFATGYGVDAVRSLYGEATAIAKPYSMSDIRGALSDVT